jgi:GWxTD domain-containing protein
MRRILGLAFCMIFFALGIGLNYSFSSPVDTSQKDKIKSTKKNSKDDQERPQYYKKWLDEDVVYIITDEEKAVFKSLKTEEERETFIEQFWARRNPDQRSTSNEFKEEHYRRIAYANQSYASGVPGWKTDRGRIYIMYGKPDETESHPSGGSYNRESWEGGGSTSTYPFERWWYRHIDGVGDDIEIEFVDRCMCNEYKIAMNADEKDALINVPGAGLTMNEQLGLSEKKDRPYFSGYTADPKNADYMRAKDKPFARLEQYVNLQRAPQIKFNDLKSLVTTKVTYNSLPYSMRTDFIRLSEDKVLVPITIELQNKELGFKKELDFNRASVNVYGLVTSLTNKIMAEFEDVIGLEYTDATFEQGKNARSEYQKIISLPPGQRFKLDLVLKDINSENIGAISTGIVVPKYTDENLECSTIILANSVSTIPETSDQLEQFVIGDLKILPNVKSEVVVGQNLIPYLQIYNATIDQTSLQPSLEVTYTITNSTDGKVVTEIKDLSGNTIQFFSGQRIVVLGKISTKGMAPGTYKLEVKTLDRISNRTVVAPTTFKVLPQAQTAALVTP